MRKKAYWLAKAAGQYNKVQKPQMYNLHRAGYPSHFQVGGQKKRSVQMHILRYQRVIRPIKTERL